MKLSERAKSAMLDYNHYARPEHKGFGRVQMDSALDTFKTETGFSTMQALILFCISRGEDPGSLFPIDHVFTQQESGWIEESRNATF